MFFRILRGLKYVLSNMTKHPPPSQLNLTLEYFNSSISTMSKVFQHLVAEKYNPKDPQGPVYHRSFSVLPTGHSDFAPNGPDSLLVTNQPNDDDTTGHPQASSATRLSKWNHRIGPAFSRKFINLENEDAISIHAENSNSEDKE